MISSPWITRPSKISTNWGWPLHVKAVGRLNAQRTEAFMSAGRWANHWKGLWTMYESAPETGVDPNALEAELSPKDIETLCAAHLIERTHTPKGMVKVFSVDEPAKGRRRMIAWPRSWNDEHEVPYELKIPFASGEQLWQTCLGQPLAWCVDMKAWYHQFNLPEHWRDKFCFKFNNEWWRVTTIQSAIL